MTDTLIAAPPSPWTAATDLLAQVLPNFELRVEQDRLAQAIEAAMGLGADPANETDHLMAQAGCGTGKSFAYLIPGIALAKRTGKPVIVATATKALQDQIAGKDAPLLAQVLHPLFGEVKIVLVKGRGNYVCADKLHGSAAEDITNIGSLREELETTGHTGDFDTLITQLDPADKPKLVTGSEECPGKRHCPFGDVCFAERAKTLAQEADVVVTNHSMLMRDVEVRRLTDGTGSLLPDPSAYVIDEGHEFEEYARGALGNEITDRTLVRFSDDVATFLKVENAGAGLRDAAQALFRRLDEMIGKETELALDETGLETVAEQLVLVLTELAKLDDRLKDHRPAESTESMQRKRLRRRLENLDARIRHIVLADDDELVRWIEREVRRVKGKEISTTKLAFSPIEVDEYLRTNLWAHTTTIFTSATLAVGDDFSFLAATLGVDEYVGFDAGTPFDFTKQAALYVPAIGYPEPTAKREEWTARTLAEMGELLAANGGRALLLFTSRRAMDLAFSRLAPGLRKQGITALRQGDAPLPALVEQKKAEPTSVLFGLKSLMTGVDFQGDCVTLVVMDKLPFPVPDDIVFAARCRVVDARAGGDYMRKSFMTLSVPIMALTLFQGHGRAIRTRTDRALIAIFDPRLRKGYGKKILQSLPRSPQFEELGNAMEYLRDIQEQRGA